MNSFDKGGRVNTFDPLATLDDQELQEVDTFMNGGIIGLNPKIMEKLQAPHGPPDLVRDYIHSMSEQMPPDLYADNLANEFERSMHLHNGPHATFDEMEKFYREAEQQHRFGPPQFDHFRENDFDRFYREANDVDRWAQEFRGERPIEEIERTPEEWAEDFERGIMNANQELDKDEFAKEFDLTESSEADMYKQANEWANEFHDFDDSWVREWNSMNHLKDYEFTNPEENPYITHPEPFKKGIELFNEGRLSQAILAFEAQLLEDPNNSQCWEMLGKTHAENDKDSKAITALMKAIEVDPQNLDAMSALAVSYTNDLYRDQALDVLVQWMQKHPKYQGLHFVQQDYMGNFDLYHKAVSELYMEAARLRPDDPDPDVQTSLGLLFNLNLDYDKAVDCFKAALSVRPDDYLLWNKLGATLANSNRSEEAIGCYFNALNIKPSFVRARSNLGISFMALQEYEKAAVYFLQALTMHPNAKHIWSNLHMVFLSMGREDLVQRSLENNETDVECFRDAFEF